MNKYIFVYWNSSTGWWHLGGSAESIDEVVEQVQKHCENHFFNYPSVDIVDVETGDVVRKHSCQRWERKEKKPS